MLHSVTPANNGHYKVVISNDAGSTTSVNATLTVTDSIAPIITCPVNLAVCTSSNSAIVTFGLPAASDNCDPAPSVVANPPSGSAFPVGSTTVTLTATDGSGNSGTCTFTVTVVHADAPTLTGVSYTGGTFQFSFPTQNGCTYLVQYKDTVDAAGWTTLETVPGDGSVKTVSDATATGTSRFYQVKVQ